MNDITQEFLNKEFEFYSSTWKNENQYNYDLYSYFHRRVNEIEYLLNHFNTVSQNGMGYGEQAYRYFWLVLINQLPKDFRFLEIGVFKGSVLTLVKLISDKLEKTSTLFGISPLDSSGDRYLPKYMEDDYVYEIGKLYSLLNLNIDTTTLIKGYSTDPTIKKSIKSEGMFDVIYIDGSHNYEDVISDIDLCDSILKPNGFLVFDDASFELNMPTPFKGWPDVSKAIHDRIDIHKDYTHLFACGHNRVWRKH